MIHVWEDRLLLEKPLSISDELFISTRNKLDRLKYFGLYSLFFQVTWRNYSLRTTTMDKKKKESSCTCDIMLDDVAISAGQSHPWLSTTLFPCADRLWSSIISLNRTVFFVQDHEDGSFFFLSRVVQQCWKRACSQNRSGCWCTIAQSTKWSKSRKKPFRF